MPMIFQLLKKILGGNIFMKLMIASDIHGSAYYCEKMVEAYKREQADRLLLLGDILYHGPKTKYYV